MDSSAALGAPPDVGILVRRFQALSDPTRIAILASLRDGECCVCDLQTTLEAAQSRLSFHLRVLKEAGLVTDRKQGRWSWYQLVPEAIESLHGALDQLSAGRRVYASAPPTGGDASYPSQAAVPAHAPLPLLNPDAVQADGCCG